MAENEAESRDLRLKTILCGKISMIGELTRTGNRGNLLQSPRFGAFDTLDIYKHDLEHKQFFAEATISFFSLHKYPWERGLSIRDYFAKPFCHKVPLLLLSSEALKTITKSKQTEILQNLPKGSKEPRFRVSELLFQGKRLCPAAVFFI